MERLFSILSVDAGLVGGLGCVTGYPDITGA